MINPFCFELTKTACALLKGSQAMILRRVFRVITVAFGLDGAKAADANLRCTDQITNAGRARHLLPQRDEEARLHRIASVTLRHVNIVSVLEEAEASCARVA